MATIIRGIEQGSIEWHALRAEIPTSSNFGKIITSKGARSTTYMKYAMQKATEIISGEPVKSYKNGHMQKGNDREDEGGAMYSFVKGVEIEKVTFCYFDEKKEFGGSPDGLVGNDGIWENKNTEGHIQMDRIDNGWKNSEHFVQCQGNLLCAEREWCDLQSYSRGFKPVIKRIYRDEPFIKKMRVEIGLFNEDVQELVRKYKL